MARLSALGLGNLRWRDLMRSVQAVLRVRPIVWLVGLGRAQVQRPGLFAAAVLIYLIAAGIGPVPEMGALMAQEIIMTPHAAPVEGAVMPDLIAQIQIAPVWLALAVIGAALAVLVFLGKGRAGRQRKGDAMDPFERLLQRRLVEKAHEADRAMMTSDLLRA